MFVWMAPLTRHKITIFFMYPPVFQSVAYSGKWELHPHLSSVLSKLLYAKFIALISHINISNSVICSWFCLFSFFFIQLIDFTLTHFHINVLACLRQHAQFYSSFKLKSQFAWIIYFAAELIFSYILLCIKLL